MVIDVVNDGYRWLMMVIDVVNDGAANLGATPVPTCPPPERYFHVGQKQYEEGTKANRLKKPVVNC